MFWLNHQDGTLQMSGNHPPRTTENLTGMALFRCCTASSCASGLLDVRCPPNLLGRRAVPHEVSGVTRGALSAQPRLYHCSHPILLSLMHPRPSSMHLWRIPPEHLRTSPSPLSFLSHLAVCGRQGLVSFSTSTRSRIHSDHPMHEVRTSISRS